MEEEIEKINTSTRLSAIEKEVEGIRERNRRVELDKRWEGSYTRKALLMFFTYLAIGFYLQAIDVLNPWLNAIVPAVAFLLSTLTMPFFKKIWESFDSTKVHRSGLIEVQAKEKAENKQKILKMLSGQDKITNRDVENGLKVSDATATRYLDELEKEGVLKQIGTNGQYVYYQKII